MASKHVTWSSRLLFPIEMQFVGIFFTLKCVYYKKSIFYLNEGFSVDVYDSYTVMTVIPYNFVGLLTKSYRCKHVHGCQGCC